MKLEFFFFFFFVKHETRVEEKDYKEMNLGKMRDLER